MNYPDEYREGGPAPKRPRKLKKAIQKALIIYDVNGIPSGVDFSRVAEMFHDSGILVYDSHGRSGIASNVPKIVGRKNKRLTIKDSNGY
jgi:hypothetical protein